ncbi:MAG: sulfotransferase domain-containing protein [Candidatus Cyclobacteriaceae bacterium M2_1C_046]
MKILQAGAAKSGNFWLYKIIDNIFKAKEISKKSFVRDHPIYELAKDWKLSYPEQSSIDMLDIENRKCFWRISSIFRKPIENIDDYIAGTSHVWTHSLICDRSPEIYKKFDKVVYIIRDPRDRILSEAKFAFSDYMQQYFPCEEKSPEEYLEKNFVKSMNRWRWHVYDHLRFAKELDIHVVFYERLLKDFDAEFDRLLNYLDISMDERKKQWVNEQVQFNTMKKENARHLNKKHYGTWDKVLNEKDKEIAEEINEQLLKMMKYPNGRFIEGLLPELPSNLSKEYMEGHLMDIGKKYYERTVSWHSNYE